VSSDDRIVRLPADLSQRRAPDPRTLRSVLGRFGTGVTVLSVGGAQCHGMTANSFTSLSLDPPLVLACVGKSALMHAAILGAGSYGVSILGAHQERLARYFADRRRPSGVDQFDVTDWFPGTHSGAPLLVGAVAWLECELVDVYDGGDHSIFVGQVLDMGQDSAGGALLFLEGDFHQFAPPSARTA
jgi:flavin reductase (DIM6/NTAB) family NADH-FMN oxidoreductase RutF